MTHPKPRGRYAAFEALVEEARSRASKRPVYHYGIGIYAGSNTITAYIKIHLPKGAIHGGRHHPPGASLEIKMGRLSSWPWKALEAARDDYQGKADRGEPLEDEPVLRFSEAAQEWFALRRPHLKGPATVSGHIKKHLTPAFGQTPTDKIGIADINEWQANARVTLTPATVKRIKATLNSIMKYQVRLGRIERNPVSFSDRIKGDEPRTRVLSDSELRKVLKRAGELDERMGEQEDWKTIGAPWLEDFIIWSLLTGLRKSESHRLRFEDITSSSGQVQARIRETKSARPRSVPLGAEAQRVVERTRAIPRREGDRRLFPVSANTLTRRLAELWRTCGVHDVRLHDLRRSYISRLVANGLDLRTVQEVSGHSDLKTLQRHYAQPANINKVASASDTILSLGQ